jgi:hypothetical protein
MWRLGKITLIVLLVGLLSTNAGAHGKIRSRGGLSVGSGDGRYIRRDGGNSPTADIPWGSNKITGLTDPAASQDAATKEYVDTTLGGVYFNYFLSDTATGEGAPLDNDNLMYAAETGEAASTVSATTTADGTLIKSFVTEAAEPTFTILVPGTYTLYTHAEVDQTLGYKDNTIYWVLNAVDADGQNPTILMTSEESGVLTTSMTSYVLHANLATQTILGATERLTLEIFSNEAGAGSDPQVTITIEGDHDCRLAVLTTVTAFDDRYILESGDTSPAGTYTFTSDAFNITSSTTLKPDFSIINTNDDGNAPRIDLQKNGTSPADDDRLGVINFKGEDSGSTTTTFVQIVAESEEVNDGDEAGSFCLRVFHDDGTPAADDMFCILGDNGTPGQGYAAFNNDSKDMDFWIESDDEDHFFYIDAASNWLRVGDWDTNYTAISNTGAITQAGSATLTLQDGSDLIMTANANASPFLAEDGDDVTGDLQLGEIDIKLDALLSGDAKWSGIVISGTSGVTTLAVGDLCYLNADDSRWELVDANLSDGYDKQLGICVLSAGDGSATEMLVYGKIRAATLPALTVGSPVYMSETAGDVTHTAPTTTDACVRIMGFAITAEDLFFNPSNDYYTHT